MNQVDLYPRTIREWRAIHQLSKSDMARRLKVTPSTYANWEMNPEKITIQRAIELSEIFGCPVGKIIFFEKNRKFNLESLQPT
ncbi:helix-turn-helix domain-containing protein [Paenibacillus lactis]|uniref:helix-turn-helix transcriptional regulator n=1 Tax=Paenibacillus lactis TaxID=228574 RepID=UPI00203A3A00|nr:helix-turn-helix transcriptional regulator [Paenibacillus lactis]MCM3492891.1 helix-turn-helix domain-containing protein [Paenibacillus lactis]